MKYLGLLALLALAGGGLAGCGPSSEAVQKRFEVKAEAFEKEHGRPPTKVEESTLLAQAESELRSEMRKENVAAGKDAVAGAVKLATGDYIGGGILVGGAVLTWLGLTRRRPETEPAPTKTEAAPAAAAETKPDDPTPAPPAGGGSA